jgi:hypothetical protein
MYDIALLTSVVALDTAVLLFEPQDKRSELSICDNPVEKLLTVVGDAKFTVTVTGIGDGVGVGVTTGIPETSIINQLPLDLILSPPVVTFKPTSNSFWSIGVIAPDCISEYEVLAVVSVEPASSVSQAVVV